MKGTKELLTPLVRKDRGIKNDPQFSGYMPSYKYVVFHDYGHPEHLGAETFKTKAAAVAWIEAKKRKAVQP